MNPAGPMHNLLDSVVFMESVVTQIPTYEDLCRDTFHKDDGIQKVHGEADR